MLKAKTLKFSLIFMSMVAIAILFFTTQVSYASEGDCNNVNQPSLSNACDSNQDNIGAVYNDASVGYFFTNYAQFNMIISGTPEKDYLKNSNSLKIVLNKQFDFDGKQCFIKNNKIFKFELNGNSLISKNNTQMFNVEGTLILENGSVRQVGSESTIKVCNSGKIQADHVTFQKPDDGADLCSEGGMFYFDRLNNDQVFTNCEFAKNKAKDGGSIYVNSCLNNGKLLKFDNCKFNGCHANGDGGAIYNDSKYVNFEFNNTSFENCNADGDGGAIASIGNNERYTFNNSTIDDCSAWDGGAIYNRSRMSDYIFNSSSLKFCKARSRGGAIFSSVNDEYYYFHNSTINACHADYQGGAIFMKTSTSNIHGFDSVNPTDEKKYSTICNCSAQLGGAIATSGDSGDGNHIRIKGFNFINNNADKNGGAIENCGRDNIIENCYFKGNSANTGKDYDDDYGDLKLVNCTFC